MKKIVRSSLLLFVAALSAFSCSQQPGVALTMSGLDATKFDTIVEGKAVALYTLSNDAGMEVCVTNYGTRIVSVMVSDRDGVMRDVVLGFDNIDQYMANVIPFGATIGRNANRIRDARFAIDGVEYKLEANDNNHSTHGGPDGWSAKIFSVDEVTKSSITMSYFSPDGESGFPGNVEATVVYTLDEQNTINIDYRATTDAPTVINFTNHSYFCTTGDPSKSMMGSSILFKSDYYAPKAADNVPSGILTSVDGTPYDFRKLTNLDKCLTENSDFAEIKGSNGFGASILLRNEPGDDDPDIVLTNPESGIVMEVFTSQPSVQFFSCNAYDKEHVGKSGVVYLPRNAICLETQHLPNAVNVPDWESPVVRPGEVYSHYCNYRFSVEE